MSRTGRILLTRDRKMLARRDTCALWFVTPNDAAQQFAEVTRHFGIRSVVDVGKVAEAATAETEVATPHFASFSQCRRLRPHEPLREVQRPRVRPLDA